MFAGLTNSGRPSSSASAAGRPGVSSVLANATVAGLGDAVGGQHLLGHRLVHRQRRAEHARADVGDVGQLEQALHRAVLAHRAVQQRHDDGVHGAGEHVGRHRSDGRRRVEAVGQRVGSGSQRRPRTLGERPRPSRAMPTGVMSYFAGSAARSTCAAVVQLTSCSADWPPNSTTSLDSIACSPCRPDGTVCGDAIQGKRVAAATGGRLVGPDVDIDGVGSTPARCAPASCSCRWSPSATATSSSTPHCEPVPRAYLTSRPAARRHGDRGRRHAAGADGPRLQHMRRSFAGTVIGITGIGRQDQHQGHGAGPRSAPAGARAANERSFNNEQGLPTTILNTPDDTEVMVLEMGMRGFGEIAALCRDRRAARSASSPASPRRTAIASAASTASPGPRPS